MLSQDSAIFLFFNSDAPMALNEVNWSYLHFPRNLWAKWRFILFTPQTVL